jgi:hypothetical protein
MYINDILSKNLTDLKVKKFRAVTFFHVTVGNVTGQNEIGNRTEIIIYIFRLFEYKTRILEIAFFNLDVH